jgi:hypothetical protein
MKQKILYKTEDGSFVDQSGKVIFFSTERFVKDICKGSHCFICGVSPSDKDFNDEHILPDWLLRKYDLYNKRITLPNGASHAYRNYTIPCCVDCNELLGKTFEEPISRLFSKGIDAIYEHLQAEGPWLFSTWMCLIYLKTHLKDALLGFHLDKRKGKEKISDLYLWDELHHIHCLVRAFYTGTVVDAAVHGSFITLPALVCEDEQFDFVDNYYGQTVLLRIDDVAFIQVVNDCGASLASYLKMLKITGPLHALQVRELFVRFAFNNMRLMNRPQFRTEFRDKLPYITVTKDPAPYFEEPDASLYGATFYNYCSYGLENNPEKEQIMPYVMRGEWSFLWDIDGEWIDGKAARRNITEI